MYFPLLTILISLSAIMLLSIFIRLCGLFACSNGAWARTGWLRARLGLGLAYSIKWDILVHHWSGVYHSLWHDREGAGPFPLPRDHRRRIPTELTGEHDIGMLQDHGWHGTRQHRTNHWKERKIIWLRYFAMATLFSSLGKQEVENKSYCSNDHNREEILLRGHYFLLLHTKCMSWKKNI